MQKSLHGGLLSGFRGTVSLRSILLLFHLQLFLLAFLQFEEVDELVSVFSGGEFQKVPRDPVAQTGTGLHRHLTGGVAERRALLLVGDFSRRQLLPAEQQRVGHLSERVQVDQPHPSLTVSVDVKHKIFVQEVVLNVLAEELLYGLTGLLFLLEDVLVILSVVSLADGDQFVFFDEAAELSTGNQLAPLSQDQLIVDDRIWGILVTTLTEWLCEVVGDEVRTFEEQKYITEAVTLKGTVQSNPVSIPRSAPVEFGKDAATQGIYRLQHFRGEFWELGSCDSGGCLII